MTNNLSIVQAAFSFFTGPRGPPSINDAETAAESAACCIEPLKAQINLYDAFVVACYSVHPLVDQLKALTRKPVVGIFEASITTCLHLLGPNETFGIVSTGKIWETLLTDGVHGFLGLPSSAGRNIATRFAGVETTGLTATELHETDFDQVQTLMKAATSRLIHTSDGKLGAVCLGCAAMAGLHHAVREACVQDLGPEAGSRVRIVDGVVSAVAIALGLVRLPS